MRHSDNIPHAEHDFLASFSNIFEWTVRTFWYNPSMYHGIILDAEFEDPTYPERLKIFAKRKSTSNDWILYGVEVSDEKVPQIITEIQANMKSDQPYYAHLYNDEKLIVIFKNEVFEVSPHLFSWKPIIDYGKKLNIPEDQLDFWPNRFQDEIHYFQKEDFIK